MFFFSELAPNIDRNKLWPAVLQDRFNKNPSQQENNLPRKDLSPKIDKKINNQSSYSSNKRPPQPPNTLKMVEKSSTTIDMTNQGNNKRAATQTSTSSMSTAKVDYSQRVKKMKQDNRRNVYDDEEWNRNLMNLEPQQQQQQQPDPNRCICSPYMLLCVFFFAILVILIILTIVYFVSILYECDEKYQGVKRC